MRVLKLAGLLLVLALAGQAQKLNFDFGKLAAKAKEVVDVNLDGTSLQFASKFLSDKDADEAQAKKVVSGLKGIYVKSFEFEKPGAYTTADVQALRAQLSGPQWSRIVDVHSEKDGENAEVYLRTEAGKVTGLSILAAEPTELTVVHIVGAIDPDSLNQLGGQFGIPKLPPSKPKAK